MPRTEDLGAIRDILETDRSWAAYALADLEPRYASYCEWYLAPGGILLLYRGLQPPVLFALGVAQDIRPLLREIAGEREISLAVRPEVPPLMEEMGYRIHAGHRMRRMVLDPGRFRSSSSSAVRLSTRDHPALVELYADREPLEESPAVFDISMLEHGVYYGIREGADLVAAAGTHIVGLSLGAGAVGNVYTRRDRRGRGYGAAVTAAVTAELIEQGARTIVLNVAASNSTAIRLYERLGFRQYCEFLEGVAVRT